MASVKNNGEVIEFASTGLHIDREIVMYAVNQDGDVLEFAS